MLSAAILCAVALSFGPLVLVPVLSWGRFCPMEGACNGNNETEIINEEMNVFDCVQLLFELAPKGAKYLTFSYDENNCALYSECKDIVKPPDCPSCFSYEISQKQNCSLVEACTLQRKCQDGSTDLGPPVTFPQQGADVCRALCDRHNATQHGGKECNWAQYELGSFTCTLFETCKLNNSNGTVNGVKTVPRDCFRGMFVDTVPVPARQSE